MTTNILITGSQGFVGKHLKYALKNTYDNIVIYEFTRLDTIETLETYIKNIDFIYHLAGEVHPSSSHDSFFHGNVTLTKNLLETIIKLNLNIPILLASSIHAVLQKNDYGQTKRQAEELILNYHANYQIPVYIYRLPHLFGENCKPNHNSVISTWIYNSIHNLPINIYDRHITMKYCYVQDIAQDFMTHLYENKIRTNPYIEPSCIYETSLGQIVDYLEEFQKNINNKNYIVKEDKFKLKLYTTYQHYMLQSAAADAIQ